MHCKQIRKRLLLYLDDDLPSAQREAVQRHLASCTRCTEHHKQLEKIWHNPKAFDTIEPSPWLWSRIVARLSDARDGWAPLAELRSWIADHAVPIAAAAMIVIGILTGIFLGTMPQTASRSTATATAMANARTDFIKTSYLDAFDDLPPSSIGGAYLALETNSK